jgi:UDP-N-acetylmuramyl tripeptide synthase
MIKLFFSLLIGKLIQLICRLLPAIGGSALPGLVSLRLDPRLIEKLVKKNNLQSIIITGTNGKTTTSRLLGAILQAQSTPYLHNRTGSNLLRGIVSTLINQTNLLGQLSVNSAVWEVDEAVAPEAIKQLKPQILLFTNLFRDQLDRYGEIDTILQNWQKSLRFLPRTSKLIVNIDDPSLNQLAISWSHPSRTITFGLSEKLAPKTSPAHAADALFCPDCLKPLQFTHVFTSHLGHYHCSSCSFKRQKPQLTLSSQKQTPSLPGLHNLYNLLAATSLAQTLNISQTVIHQAIKDYQPAFGRAESFKLGRLPVNILLVKNPAGFNITLETLQAKKHLHSQPLLLILNDLIADGTDVSWIWDVDFELLKKRQTPLVVSGLRAPDLALRLKYAGLKPHLITIQPSLKKALSFLKHQPGSSGYILPTYTAMLQLREILRKQKLIHSTWED